jgi:propionyl-CoA carboxylase alpha chain
VVEGENGKQSYTPASIQFTENHYEVDVNSKKFSIQSDWKPGEMIFRGFVNSQPIVFQMDRIGLVYQLDYSGMQFNAMIMTPFSAGLQKLMPFKAPPDLSKFLLSPMPGLLR